MDDALLVRRFQARGDLTRVLDRRFHGDRTREVRALHQFHDQRALLHAVDGGDVDVVERSQHLRFPFEAHHPPGIGGKAIRD